MKATLIALFLSLLFVGCMSRDKKDTPAASQDAKQESTQGSAQESTGVESPSPMNEETPPRESSPDHPYEMHWGYEGDLGPEHWGDLRDDYKTCKTGKLQSPIDLKFSKPKPGRRIEFDYVNSPLKVIDNGQTIKVSFGPGNRLFVMGKQYELVHLEFHSSSEHTLSGNSLPMEAHLVHRNELGQLAIVGMMLIEGRKNPLIDKIWTHIPEHKNAERMVPGETINAEDILPKVFTHYFYVGSLTTPPCTEGVRWYVLNTPIELSREQILEFRKHYSHNNRPIQPLNGRSVTNY